MINIIHTWLSIYKQFLASIITTKHKGGKYKDNVKF